MGAVVHRTGLTAQGIRMWEKRYDAVVPKRKDTNRRLYSRTDVERLALMKQLTDAGHSISSIANPSIANPSTAGRHREKSRRKSLAIWRVQWSVRSGVRSLMQ